jgi:hypothetical protein
MTTNTASSVSHCVQLAALLAASVALVACASSDGSGAGSGGHTGVGGGSAQGGATGATGGIGTGGAATGAAGGGGPGGGVVAQDAGRDGADAAVGAGGSRDGGSSGVGGATDAGAPSPDAGTPPPPFNGPTVAGTVTVTRGTTMGHLGPGFAGFSFEKTHMTDNFFTGSNAPLIALFKLLGAGGSLRIGANDVDASTWVPSATPVAGGQTSHNIGTVEVDALAAFLTATAWKAIYGVSMRTAIQPSLDESVYVTSKLGTSLHSIEIGNEINFFASNAVGTPTMQWASFEAAIHGANAAIPLAGPAAAGAVTDFTVPFANAEGGKIILLTEHYYKGASASNPTIAQMLALDATVVTQSQALQAAVQSNRIRDGYRWGEMNSYSGHGAAGVSDVFASALWGIDFMLTTAQYGAVGVNFHSGGQNMDGNVCTNGVASCTRPFRYSPIIEVDSRVTGAAPLFYGMLLVSQAGLGTCWPRARRQVTPTSPRTRSGWRMDRPASCWSTRTPPTASPPASTPARRSRPRARSICRRRRSAPRPD